MKYLLLIAFLVSANACADFYLTLGGWSVHDKKYIDTCANAKYYCIRQKYNYNHKSLIVDYKGFTLGTYENSYFNRTNLIGYTYRKHGFSAIAAYGTGYRVENVDGSCPVKLGKECLLLSVGYTFQNLKLSLMGDAAAVSFEFKIK